MLDFLSKLFDTADFPARWGCGRWTDGHGWLHILSDLAIFVSYFSIPVALVIFTRRREHTPHRELLGLFAIFILSCGVGHALEALIFWVPIYRFAGLVKLLTAAVSLLTAAVLLRELPQLLELRSPAVLERQVQERTLELRQERERLAMMAGIVYASHNGVLLSGLDGRVREANDSAERIFGRILSDIVGRSISELLPEDVEIPAWVKEADASGVVVPAREMLITSKRGREAAYQVSSFIVSGADAPLGLAWILIDVTERRDAMTEIQRLNKLLEARAATAESARRATQEDLVETITSIGEVSFELDVLAERYVWSGAIAPTFGLSPDVWLTCSAGFGHIHPDDRALWRRELEAAASGSGAFTVEYRVRRGEEGWIRVRERSLLEVQGGDVTRVRGALQVVDRELGIIAQLELQQRRLRTLLTALSDVVFWTDPDGRITEPQPAWEHFSGQSWEACRGHGWREAFDEASREAMSACCTRENEGACEARKGRVWSQEHEDWRDCEFIVQGLRDRRGELDEWLTVVNDVTERNRRDDALAEALQESEDAAVALRRSNMDLEQFAYVTSHDLQEPLRMISSYLQLLERRYKERFEGEPAELFGYVIDGAARMKRLIQDLLQYSRLRSRARPISDVDLGRLWENACRDARVSIEESEASVTCGPLPTIRGDETQLGQLLANLLGNALKFRAEGRAPDVRFEVHDGGEVWRLQVSDNGIGIEPEYHAQIFEIFRRLHEVGRFPGTGIGLALCRRIAQRHGGDIEVDSTPGEGTTFTALIPKEPTDEPRA